MYTRTYIRTVMPLNRQSNTPTQAVFDVQNMKSACLFFFLFTIYFTFPRIPSVSVKQQMFSLPLNLFSNTNTTTDTQTLCWRYVSLSAALFRAFALYFLPSLLITEHVPPLWLYIYFPEEIDTPTLTSLQTQKFFSAYVCVCVKPY